MEEENKMVDAGKSSKDGLGHVEEQTQDELETVEEVVEDKEEKQEVVEATAEKKEDNKKKRDKDNLYEEVEIPEGITGEIVDDVLIVSKEGKEVKRKLIALIDVKVEGNKIIISANRNRKIEKKLFGTFKAHVKNMIKGLSEGFEYKLKISNVHFPMNVSLDANNNVLVVKNFLGEKKDRIISLIDGVDVKVDKEDVIVSGYDIEKTGDVAARIEKGTRVRNKDRRVYQDGIFITEKPGRVYL